MQRVHAIKFYAEYSVSYNICDIEGKKAVHYIGSGAGEVDEA